MKTALSPFNEKPTRAPASVLVADCTLRDGEQQAGLVFSRDHKVRIAKMLIELGVHEIEAGSPAVSVEDRDAVAEIAELDGVRVSALAIAREEAIDVVADTGAWGVRISLPAGELQLKHKVRLSESEYFELAHRVTTRAKERGLYVVFSPYDTTRAEEGFLRRVVKTMARSGAVDRFRLVDTAGAATPHAISYLVGLMLEEGEGTPVEVHVHDDLGLATANTVAGVLAGAEYVSTSMNSLGERSGNAATEQVCAALEILYGIRTGLDLSRLHDLSEAVSWFAHVPLPPNTPVVGSNAFSHESGLVTAGVLANPFTAEPYDPAIVGQVRRIVHGKKSGSHAVRHEFEARGYTVGDDVVSTALTAIKREAAFLERALGDAEVAEILAATAAAAQ